jgi:TM2 domain-containing membrane protein YozV
MNLSTTQKVVLGIFTILPLALLPYIFIQAFYTFLVDVHDLIDVDSPDSESQREFFIVIMQFMIPSMILSLVSLGLLIIYLIHAAKNNSLNTTERLVWILIFVFAGIIGFPIYWYLQIWKTPAATNYTA